MNTRVVVCLTCMLGGCATAQVDAALSHRVAPSSVSFGPQIAFDRYVVGAIRGPDAEPDARGRRALRFELAGPDDVSVAECFLGASSGSIATRAQASLVCDSETGHTIVSGYGSTQLFALSRVSGRAEHQDAQREPALGRRALSVDGSGLVYNLYRGGVNGQPRGAAVAALTLEPVRVWMHPSLEPDLRAHAALLIGALLTVHGRT